MTVAGTMEGQGEEEEEEEEEEEKKRASAKVTRTPAKKEVKAGGKKRVQRRQESKAQERRRSIECSVLGRALGDAARNRVLSICNGWHTGGERPSLKDRREYSGICLCRFS